MNEILHICRSCKEGIIGDYTVSVGPRKQDGSFYPDKVYHPACYGALLARASTLFNPMKEVKEAP